MSFLVVWRASNLFASCFSTRCMVIFAPYKGIHDNLGFWIPYRGFRIAGTGIRILVGGTWIPDSNHIWNPGSLSCIPESKAQDSGFLKKIMSRIPQSSSSKCFSDSGNRIPLHGAINFSEISKVTRATFTHCV